MSSAVDAELAAIAERLLDLAKRAGADQADVLVARSESLSVSVRGGALEEAERAESLDYGLRVLIDAPGGRRQACVSASDPSDGALTALTERAVAMARETPEDPDAGLAEAADLTTAPPDLELSDPETPADASTLRAQAVELEDAARAVPGVAQAEGAGVGWSASRFALTASNGFVGGYASGSHSASVSAVAGEGLGMERDYAFTAARRRGDLRPLAEIGREAGERAVRRLSPKKPRTGPAPVLFEPRVAASLIGALLGAANAASVARGSSFLKDKMGERVLPAGMDVIDDPLLPRGLGSRPFDAEGLTTRRKRIVADGVLSEWLLDLASARKLGLTSNGCATRGVGGPPSPSSSNVWVTPGALSPEALMAETGEGLYVTEMMGRGANPVTGDYSRGASGFWFSDGEIVHPVSEITVAGHILEMLGSLTAADDLVMDRRVVAPTLRVAELTIAAE